MATKKTTKKTTAKKQPERFILLRTRLAGVHVGTLVSVDALLVTLKDVRRLWRWRTIGGGATLSEISLRGADEAYSRISEPVAQVQVPLADVAELIDCTPAARANLERSRWPA